MLEALEPMALEAAREAERMQSQVETEARRVAELELEQARYEAKLAERRYAACDPEHRLIAAQLERSWEEALQRVRSCEERLAQRAAAGAPAPEADLESLAGDLEAAWDAPGTTMRTRQRLVRTLIEDILTDLDEATGEIVLVIHWKGGQHSELRVRKPKTGEHRRRTSEEAGTVIRSMVTRWSDEQIAASLNRMGLRTGQERTWNASRVRAFRITHAIPAYRSKEKGGEWLTMSEAAQELGVTNHVVRRLIRDGDLPAEQVVRCAPYQIRLSDLRSDRVREAAARRGRPCRTSSKNQIPLISHT
jgi:excisionase family DNA binding protein